MGYLIMFIGLATLLVGIGWLIVSLFTKKPRNAFIVAVVGMVVLVIGIMVAPKENDTKADKPKTEKVDKKSQASSKKKAEAESKKEASESSVQKDNEKLAMDDFNSYLASKDYGSAKVDTTDVVVITLSDSLMSQSQEDVKPILQGIVKSFNNYCEGNEWEDGENSRLEFNSPDGTLLAHTGLTGKVKLENE